jgi:4-carboxymuconolactone decarboxylase
MDHFPMNLRRTALAALFALPALAAQGADRLPTISPAQYTAEQKQAAADFEAARKTPVFGPFEPLMHSPEVMSQARAMGDYLRYKSALPPRLSEFVILLTARRWTQQYEWNAHRALALQGGLRAEIVDAIADGRRPEKMAADEDTVYTFCDEITKTQGVSDATYARAVGTLGEQGVVDTLGLTGYYTMLAMVLNTARTPLPAGAAPGLKPLR